MRIRSLKKTCGMLAGILIIVSGLGESVSAQSVSIQAVNSLQNARTAQNRASDELLKQYELALIEIERLRAQVAGKDQIIEAKDNQIAALNALESIQKMRIQALLDAVKERQTVTMLDDKRIALYEASITDFKENTSRLIRERDSARRGQKVWAAVSFILGGVLGHQLAK
jgi:hypothetical protein